VEQRSILTWPCVEVRKWIHGMIKIIVLCFRWLSLFFNLLAPEFYI